MRSWKCNDDLWVLRIHTSFDNPDHFFKATLEFCFLKREEKKQIFQVECDWASQTGFCAVTVRAITAVTLATVRDTHQCAMNLHWDILRADVRWAKFVYILSFPQSLSSSHNQLQRRCLAETPVWRQPAHRARVVLPHPSHGADKRCRWHRYRLEHQDPQLRHPWGCGQPQANAWWSGSSAHGTSVRSLKWFLQNSLVLAFSQTEHNCF